MKEALYKTLKFSKGYIYGFALMFLVPRQWFDQMAIAYYDIMEPETINTPISSDNKE